MKVRCVVDLELVAPDLDAVSDLVHKVWGFGDPTDMLNACIVVRDEREVEQFSWEREPS